MQEGSFDFLKGFGAFSSMCPQCGAGLYNRYVHSPNCLINIPTSHIIVWQKGKEDRLHGKPCTPPDEVEENLSNTTYIMGWNLADVREKQHQSEHSFKAVDQAINQIRNL